MTDYLDISVPIVPGLVPLYPGDTPLEVERVQSLAAGEGANVSRLTCSLHCGTHVDAPVHFLDGEPGVEAVDVDSLIGPAYVADARHVAKSIDAAALADLEIPVHATRVLFRTSNSELWDQPRFVENFVALTADGAAAVVERGVRLVGIDYLSIAPYNNPAPTHEVLLRAGVTILETVDLHDVEPGPWHLTCLPLRIPGADGAPARAVLHRTGPPV